MNYVWEFLLQRFVLDVFSEKLISYKKLHSPTYICSLSHSQSQLFYLRFFTSKRLTRQMVQPSVVTFQKR
jgi:hypothetical protein